MSKRIVVWRAAASRSCRWSFCVAMAIALIGCGPSQQELMLRSAQRARTPDDEDEPPPKQEVVQAQPTPEVEQPAEPQPQPEPPPVEIRSGEKIEEKSLLSVEERKPAQPLSDEERRRTAFDNLTSVSEALLAYARDKKQLPPTYQVVDGFKTLSWRVEILPYLGYAELYKKFDKRVPWNRSPNKELLQFIPDQYVSPERFDTNTNIVMPSRDGMIGGDGGRANPDLVEDGLANTLLLIEVNDDHAVPWTAPEDFAPQSKQAAREGVLGLRKDGMFGVWANGFPVLLASELNQNIFWDAMTMDAGDGLMAGRVHRDIPIRKVSDASVAAMSEEPVEVTPEPQPSQQYQPPAASVAPRQVVPTAGQLAKVQRRLRGLFSEQIVDAKTDDEKRKLADEMLEMAAGVSDDPVGGYALQTAAMRVAVDGGGIQQLIAAIDQRIGQYEVDAYEENKNWLIEFGRAAAKKDVKQIDGLEYARRAVKVMFAAVHEDEYVEAISLNRIASRLLDQKRDEEIPQYLSQLRGLLGGANREFENARKAITDYRIDPNDGEAAAVVGRYLCFIKGDWQKGLPLLAQGGPDSLRRMAQRDIQGAKDYVNQVAIGDGWWALSERARPGVYQQSARDRSVFWYEQAIERMPDSLDRLHVKSRLDEAQDAPPSSPLALISELANELDVDLSVGLAAVADVGQRRNQDNDDDDD